MSAALRASWRPARTADLAILGTGSALFVALSLASLRLSAGADWVLFVPALAIGGCVGVWSLLRACQGCRWSMIAWLAILLFFTDSALRPRAAGETGADWQNMMKLALWLGAAVIGFCHMPPVRELLARRDSALLLAFCVVCLVSGTWSPLPGYSIGTAFTLLAFFVFALAVNRHLSEVEILWVMVLVTALFLLVGWVVYYVYPALGRSTFWTYGGMVDRAAGIAGQANNLGSVCAKYLAALFVLWYAGRMRLRLALPFAALGIITLAASDARTGMIAVMIGIAAVTLRRRLWVLCLSLLASFLLVMMLIIEVFDLSIIGSRFSRSGDPTEVFTLTGRLDIWQFVWQRFLDSPLIGHGYNSSKEILGSHLGFENGLMIDTAHNMVLQNLLSTGIVGTLPLLLALGCLMADFLLRPSFTRDLFVIMLLIYGLTDVAAFGSTPNVFTLLFFIFVLRPRDGRTAVPAPAAA